jgi:uncharacterized protein YbjQ (UPF0145 family)
VDVAGSHLSEPVEPDPQSTRLDRLRRTRSWSFSGPVGEFAAASIARFDPVGQVLGTTVLYLGSLTGGPCFTTSLYNDLLERISAARRVALERAVAECQALGGDGIIGVRMSSTKFLSDTMEYTVEGTAVRARSHTRPGTPFTTHVSGQDLAKLLRADWMPVALVFGIALASRHFDDSMFRQTRRGLGAAGNREVAGYTQLINDARHDARTALEAAVQDRGGQGAVVQDMTLHYTERECPLFDQHADHLAEATILGSAIVPLEQSAPAAQRAPLAILRLDPRPEAAAKPEAGPAIIPRPSLSDRAFAYRSRRTGQSW